MKTLLAILLVSVAGSTSAAIVDRGSLVTDTETQLDWLKLTNTNGYSYTQTVARLRTGGDLYGWRYATASEVLGLYIGAGLPAPFGSGNDLEGWQRANAFANLLGITYEYGGFSDYFSISGGMFGSPTDYFSLRNVVEVAAVIVYDPNTTGGATRFDVRATARMDFNGINDAGASYLVRATSPVELSEPSTALLALPLLAFCFVAQRRTH